MNFELLHTDPGSSARAGLISTDHGTIETPIFMPVGTVGSVKGVFHRDLADEAGAQIILGNTYHLYLRPGTDILERAGGLHRFCSWDRPILTDSGGFQVFSLAGCRKLSEEGCRFSSHIDGSKHLFTPEGVIDIQRSIGGASTAIGKRSRNTGIISRCSRSYRDALIPICGPARPSSSGSSTPTAMRSGDWPWANRLR